LLGISGVIIALCPFPFLGHVAAGGDEDADGFHGEFLIFYNRGE
jgi:hypothetical protein